MSGNGIRCLVQAAVDAGLVRAGTVVGGDGGRIARRGVPDRGRARDPATDGWTWARADSAPSSAPTSSESPAGASASTWATPTSCSSAPADDATAPRCGSSAPAGSGRSRTGPTWSSSGPVPAPASSPCGCGSAAWARPWRAGPGPARWWRRPTPTVRSARMSGCTTPVVPSTSSSASPGSPWPARPRRWATSPWTRRLLAAWARLRLESEP